MNPGISLGIPTEISIASRISLVISSGVLPENFQEVLAGNSPGIHVRIP